MLYQEKDDLAKSEPLYNRAIEIEMDYRRKQAPEYNSGSLNQAYFNLAVLKEKQGKFNDAVGDLRKVIALDGKSVDAWLRLALLYDKQKDPSAAENAVQDGLKAVPDQPDLLLVGAMVYQEQDSAAKAEPMYQKVVEIELGYKRKPSPEYNAGTLGQAYFNLGGLRDKQGKFDEAIAYMKSVIEVQPDNPDAYNYIGYSYADKGIQLDDAQKYVESALKLDPNNAYYLDSMGWVYFKKELYPEAREQLEKALLNLKTAQKDDAVIYDHLAQVFLKLGLKADAVAQWKKALKLDPKNKDYSEKIQKNSAPDL